MYGEKSQNPTIAEIWEHLLQTNKKKYFKNLVEQGLLAVSNGKERDLISSQIESALLEVASGLSLFKELAPLCRYDRILSQTRDYVAKLTTDQVDNINFHRHIDFLEIFLTLGYGLEETLVDYVDKKQIIKTLEQRFEKIKTPDKRRTIEDQLKGIENLNIESKLDPFFSRSNLYHDGYLMAVRGENPAIIEILQAKSYYFKFEKSLFGPAEPGFGQSAAENAHEIVTRISLGYANSYYGAFLEKRLNALKMQSDVTGNTTKSLQSSKKINWIGQKNQLYDVLRQLKNKGLIGNNYEELSIFINENIDGFDNTKISTILKEIGKEKRPPRQRRVDIKI